MTKLISDNFNTFNLFIDKLRNHKPSIRFNKLNINQWDIFEIAANYLFIVLLQGSDQTEDQCVTVYGNWNFDSNLKFASPLSKESLDLCCSLDTKFLL